MPLIHSKSKKAFKKNVETEMKAGKPQKQSLAIAFSLQRKGKKKKASDRAVQAAHERQEGYGDNDGYPASESRAYAQGGPVPKDFPYDDDFSKRKRLAGDAIEDGYPGQERSPYPGRVYQEVVRPPAPGKNGPPYSVPAVKKFKSGGPVENDFVSARMVDQDDARTPENMDMLRNRRPRSPGDVDETAMEETYDTADNSGTAENMDMLRDKNQRLPREYAGSGADQRKMYAKGGKVGGHGGGAETSTTGNKTKTGGSNPGGASTGGAGTVTITTGSKPPSISVSDVGGKTDARNAGGMDPSDEEDSMMADADKRKKYAKGGYLTNAKYAQHETADTAETDEDLDMLTASGGPGDPTDRKFDTEDRSDIDNAYRSEEMSMIDHIRSKMKLKARKGFAEGGDISSYSDEVLDSEVDIDENGEEQPNSYYDRNEHAALKENYDKDMDHVHSPMDSGQHGDDIAHDKYDEIDKIRRKMKASRGY